MASITRSEDAQDTHDRWVAVIAEERMTFPEFPQRKTYINPGTQKNYRVRTSDGAMFYPDIVVIDSSRDPADNLVLIGEVETSDSVTEAEADQWREFAKVSPVPFYLYVPKGSGARAKQLAGEGVVSGFREFSVEDGENVYEEP
jgi:hypothetical protein